MFGLDNVFDDSFKIGKVSLAGYLLIWQPEIIKETILSRGSNSQLRVFVIELDGVAE